MTVFTMKLAAMLSMLIDHATFVLDMRGLVGVHTYQALRGVGRIAFPIFCFLIVNGLELSSDRRGYISRLALFAAISQVPYSMVFTRSNYRVEQGAVGFDLSLGMALSLLLLMTAALCAVWYFTVRRDRSALYLAPALLLGFTRLEYMGRVFLSSELDVFYTLALGLAAICLLDDALERRDKRWYILLLQLAALSAAVYFYGRHSDYSYTGIALILLLYLCRSSRVLQAVALCLWSGYAYWYRLNSVRFALFACLAVIPILLYDGEPGRRAKWGFYAFYPLHLAALGILNIVIK